MSDVRKVRFMKNDGSADLYRCVEGASKGCVYARIPVRTNCEEQSAAVQWLSASRWSGGYEPSFPLREGIKLEIVDSNMQLLYTETVCSYPYALAHGKGFAEAVAPFYPNACKEEAAQVAVELQLIPHNQWRQWLLTDMPNGEEPDNWLYCSATEEKTYLLRQAFVLGERYTVCATLYRHDISGKRWWAYTIESMKGDKKIFVVEICGYKILEGEKRDAA